MSVRLRITFLFTLLVFILLSLVCSAIYYFSYTRRLSTIQTRLTNRAITTAHFLSQKEVFDLELIRKIDASTTLTLKNKTVQAYDYKNDRIYSYSDIPGDSIKIKRAVLDEARVKGKTYFTQGIKEAIAYHYTDNTTRIVIVVSALDEEGKRNLRQLQFILLFSFLGGLVIALCGGYFFSKGLLLPIRKIADEVNEISAHNFTRRIPSTDVQDEWNYLSNTLNQLLNRLQESFETQRRFISNASHELSTPLTSISSQLEIALQRERRAEEYRNIIQSVYQDVRHMSKLTQTLLEFAKASGSAGGLELHLVRIDEVLFRLPAEASKMNKQYSVTLLFDELPENEEALLVYGNEELLFTAVKNIVLNACKYSSNQQATVKLTVLPDTLTLSIQDNGMGIPPDELQYIFQPFYRVNENHNAGGFGLGLSLAYHIIRLHKGSIAVDSIIGEGTVFTVSLPTASYSKGVNF